MASLRQLKSKIRTVGNIGQITKAMEMVAATKMRKSQEIALKARPYAKEALSLLYNILLHAEKEDLAAQSHLFKRTGRITTCLVVITSDKGLCAGFNSAVLREALQFKKNHPETDIVVGGKKGRAFFAARNIPIAAAFTDFSDTATLSEVSPLTDWLLSRYQDHTYDTIVFCSTLFISALVQKVALTEVLPLTLKGLQDVIERIVPQRGRYSELAENNDITQKEISYLLEPSSQAIFESLLEDLVRVEVLHLVFESNASEHSARMVAMKNATENAKSLKEELEFELNKARQAAITQELTEISTAKEALSAE